MIVMDESENFETDFTDVTLRFIHDLYGPQIKDWLLLPPAVRLNDATIRTLKLSLRESKRAQYMGCHSFCGTVAGNERG